MSVFRVLTVFIFFSVFVKGATVLHLPLNNSAIDVGPNSANVTSTGIEYGFDSAGSPNAAGYFSNNGSFGTDRISVADAGYLDLTEAYTVSLWFKAQTFGSSTQQNWTILLRKGTFFPYGLFLDRSLQKVYAGVYNGPAGTGDAVYSKEKIELNEWYHLTSVYSSENGGTLTLYLDGVFQESKTGVGQLPVNSNSISIGSGSFSGISSAFNGAIDEVKIYNEALDSESVQALANTSSNSNWNLYASYDYDQVLSQLSLDGIESFNFPDVNPETSKLIVLIHGWVPGEWDPGNPSMPYDEGEFQLLKHAIEEELNLYSNGWSLIYYDWAKDASTGGADFLAGLADMIGIFGVPVDHLTDYFLSEHPFLAAEKAYVHGIHLGSELYGSDQLKDIEKIHFISHSAGTWVVCAAARVLLEKTDAVIQVTLLDPYIPGNTTVRASSVLNENLLSGLSARSPGELSWMDIYYADDVTDRRVENSTTPLFDISATKGKIIRTDNFDFLLDYSSEFVNQLYQRTLFYDTHGGPISFYKDSINFLDFGWYEVFNRSLKSSGWRDSLFFREKNADFNLLFPESEPVLGDWLYIGFLGYIYNGYFPWVHHPEHGMLYASGDGEGGGIWFYDTRLGWLWTTDELYPHFFQSSSDSWIYYETETTEPRWFYDYEQQQWVPVDLSG